MKTRYKQPEEPREPGYWGPIVLQTDKACAVYARQSTQGQVLHNTQSGAMQTDDLQNLAIRMGWVLRLIILYIENIDKGGNIKHASGTLRIDQREGLSALVERIEADEIKAVFVHAESRLFRDETQIQYNTFIDICKRHNCIVITPNMQYDFRNDYMADMFRARCKEAADFIKYHVRGFMLVAQKRTVAQGVMVAVRFL